MVIKSTILLSAAALVVIFSHPVALHPFHDPRVDCSQNQVNVANPHNCGQYYQCSHGEPILRSCPIGLYFNPVTLNCDWPFAVNTNGCSQPLELEKDYSGTAREIVLLRKVGELSRSEDDSSSATVCPEGTIPIDCACSIPRLCDGAFISNRNCTVFNAFPDQRQQAIATCLTELTTSEFTWVNSGSWQRSPVVTCPKDYHVIRCLLRNPWSRSGYIHAKVNLELNRCETDGVCAVGIGCAVQAVCQADVDHSKLV